MLYELYAENFALMAELRLNLGEGMNALTGETGAGKSLLIDAVSLLIGGRGSDAYIRSGCEKCLIEGIFMPPYPKEAAELLRALDLDPEDSLILSRELVRGGRSLARVNGRAVNLTRLRDLSRLLINIHGQHEHMLILEDARQLLLLDSFEPAIEHLLEDVAIAYQAMLGAESRVDDFLQNQELRSERIGELTYIVDELEKADLRPGEDDELTVESQRLAHGERLYQLATDGLGNMNSGGAALDSLNAALACIKSIVALDAQAEDLCRRQENIFYEAEDWAQELSAYRDRINLDLNHQNAVEGRLAALGKLKKKYRATIDGMINILTEARQELAALEELSFSADSLFQAREQAQASYAAAASKLSDARIAAAERLGAAITRELQLLLMPAALFRIDLVANSPSGKGNEHALFMIRSNIGEPFQPVAKIASGGELSRIMLGIKVILSKLDSVPTLIFDEVDSGLSGKALVAVAQRIAMVGESAQVLVVSHNAVMAAAAARQVLIQKREADGRTVVAAHQLGYEERVEELARMIAGNQAGEITRRQARDMLEKMSQPGLF
ncbi:MAG: DNA repair protein RecN [Clostridia bacterium]|nr:DNA repair protein RecN [Clostridia bacterium]